MSRHQRQLILAGSALATDPRCRLLTGAEPIPAVTTEIETLP